MLKKMIANKKRKGFTLVEMLIVIIIIGILAGTLMMSMGSGTSKAEATRIVSNLRTLKGACLMYYVDTNAWPDTVAVTNLTGLKKYLGGQNFAGTNYAVDITTDTNHIFTTFTGLNGTTSKDISAALAKIAPESGILGNITTSADYVEGNVTAYMLVK